MTKRRVALIAALLASAPLVALAQDLPDAGGDVAQIVSFIRWSGVFVSLLVTAGATITLRFVSSTATQLSARFTNRRLTIQKFESVARFAIYLGTAGICLALSFHINEKTLGLIAGALAFTIGFAMRDLVAAVIAGITIMFDRPFQVGDRVQYAGQYGDIIQIGLRSVRMCTLDDNIVTIPNNKILTDVTSSGNYGALDMQVAVKFLVGADQDLEEAERLVYEGFLTSRYIFLDKPIVVLVHQTIHADMVVIELTGKAYVLDTRYEKAFQTDVTKRVLMAFKEHGVLPPAVLARTQIEH